MRRWVPPSHNSEHYSKLFKTIEIKLKEAKGVEGKVLQENSSTHPDVWIRVLGNRDKDVETVGRSDKVG